MNSSFGKKALVYTTLPGLWPRLFDLLSSGFSYLSYFIAVVYQNVGLLPNDHAFLNPRNFGKFGVRHVVAAAANNLVFRKEDTDKVLIFFTVLVGLILLLVQIALIILSSVTFPVFAAWTWTGTWTDTFLTTPYGPSQDIAMIALDRVFGVMDIMGGPAGFFGSCWSDASVDCTNIRQQVIFSPSTFPSAFHLALHQMLMFYSYGIATVAMLVIIYFVIAIVGETAVSGTPFGQRFNKAWFVPRLIVFFALIAPIKTTGVNAGINGGQYITLTAAKLGSNMATNAWSVFTKVARDQYATDEISTIFGQKDSLIAFPNVPSVAKLGQFLYVARLCMYAEKILNNIDVRPYLVREMNWNPQKGMGYMPFVNVLPFLDGAVAGIFTGGTAPTFEEALEFSRYGSVVLRFGEFNAPDDISIEEPMSDFGGIPIGTGMVGGKGAYRRDWGYVKPICGEISFDVLSAPPTGGPTAYAGSSDPVVTGVIGSETTIGIQENYYLSIREYLLSDPTFEETAYCMIKAILPYDQDPTCVDETVTHDFDAMWQAHGAPGNYPSVTANTEWLTVELAQNSINFYDALNEFYINGNFVVDGTRYVGTDAAVNPYFATSIIGILRANYDYNIPETILERGWVGMAAYYQQIANINGLVFSAVQNTPTINKYPFVMEQVAQQHDQIDTKPDLSQRFNPLLQNGKLADLPRPGDQYLAAALYSGYKFWDDTSLTKPSSKRQTDNPVIDAVNTLFGTDGLFNMLNNEDVHPLAQLSALGKSMMESSIRNIFIGSSVGVLSNILETRFSKAVGPLPKAAGEIVAKIGMIGISIAFLLYYVLPLLPFVYFFFAFSGWIKAVFEAMVAIPLWALAHIKIDGQGLPGPLATNGYFLLFEIFLRPTLIVFGFMASITVFAASVSALNGIYENVVLNVAGFDLRANLYGVVVTTQLNNPSINFMRSSVDQLFYTIVYAIIVYMMALSCFKLIDQIPAQLIRFMGVGISPFHERGGDKSDELIERMSRASHITRAQLNSTIDKMKGVGEKSQSVTDRDILIQQGK